MQRKTAQLLALAAVLLLSGQVWAGVNEERFIRDLYTAVGKSHDSSADPCTYDGITCVSGRDVPNEMSYKIDLNNQGLSSNRLPDARGSSLTVYEINLSGNRGIRGQLPDSWANLQYLQTLVMAGTGVYGAIPDSWNSMRRLEKVDLSNCFLCYNIPNWSFDSMPSLREVDFSRNQLGHYSSAFGTFSASTTLTSVSLVSNQLCGCIPNTWTSAVLRNAAQASNPNALSSDCFNSNRCSNANSQCRTSGGAPAAHVALLSAVVAVLLLFAAA